LDVEEIIVDAAFFLYKRNNLAKKIATLCITLMGRKSVTRVASIFLGSRMMFVEFSLSKPWEFSENMLLIAAVMSSLIIS